MSNLETLWLRDNLVCLPESLKNWHYSIPNKDRVAIPVCLGGSQLDDRVALVVLYNATNGDNWTNNINWNTTEPVRAWQGVTTNERGRVTQLILRNNNLMGPIPPELGNLSNLERLQLQVNNLTGEIPPELGSLSNLERLYLYGNNLTGEVPSELGNLSKLQFFFLEDNEVCLPESLKRWHQSIPNRDEISICSASQTPLERADADGSGEIDFNDFLAFVTAFGTSEDRFDFNDDDVVDFNDFLIFVSFFGKPVNG